MESITNNNKNLKQIAAFLGVFQGLAWVVLSIICIVVYYRDYDYSFINSYMEEIRFMLYALYLSGSSIGFPRQKVTSNVFIGFVWTYFVIDLIWIAASVNILSKNQKHVKISINFWSAITALVCLLDFILVILLGVDYHSCLDSVAEDNDQTRIEVEGICSNGLLIGLTIAAKGFVLWIINVIFVVILVRMTRGVQEQPRNQQIGSVYPETNFVPLPKLQRQPQSPLYNPQPQFSGYNQFYENSPSLVQSSPVRGDFRRQGLQSNQYQQPFVLEPPPPRRNRY